ncbi:MAG TPA: segregation/condensation protein A, partial [Mycobacteriales bacterium]|nr:segregation/condensation protein A [Mycobacteriales bacterium]
APPVVDVMHLHNVQVSVREQAQLLRARLVQSRSGSFRGLVSDCEHTVEIVARFLAVLELFREGVLAFEQVTPLGELMVRWTGPDELDGTDAADEAMDEEYG